MNTRTRTVAGMTVIEYTPPVQVKVLWGGAWESATLIATSSDGRAAVDFRRNPNFSRPGVQYVPQSDVRGIPQN